MGSKPSRRVRAANAPDPVIEEIGEPNRTHPPAYYLLQYQREVVRLRADVRACRCVAVVLQNALIHRRKPVHMPPSYFQNLAQRTAELRNAEKMVAALIENSRVKRGLSKT